MKQNFEKLEDGKIKWSHEKEIEAFKDQDFGEIGTTKSNMTIIFDSYDKAMQVLDRDIEDVTNNMLKHKETMDKNTYDEDKFALIKPLIDKIGKLHNDFKEVGLMPAQVNGANMRKYNQFVKEFNMSKQFIVEEISAFNKDYQKYLNYGPAKKAYEFNVEQAAKIEDQKKKLLALK